MADAVQDRIEREARFASDVSHELRSPITALTAAVEVLDRRRDEIPERTQQALDVVVDQVRRFDSMVIDLLELARLDAGATDLNVEEVALIDLTRRVSSRYGEPDLPIVAAAERSDRGRDRQGSIRAYSRQLVGERPKPRRWRRTHRTECCAVRTFPPRRRGRRSRCCPGRARTDLRAVCPRAARPATASAPGSVSRSSPSTALRWVELRGSRTASAAAPDSWSNCRRRSRRSAVEQVRESTKAGDRGRGHVRRARDRPFRVWCAHRRRHFHRDPPCRGALRPRRHLDHHHHHHDHHDLADHARHDEPCEHHHPDPTRPCRGVLPQSWPAPAGCGRTPAGLLRRSDRRRPRSRTAPRCRTRHPHRGRADRELHRVTRRCSPSTSMPKRSQRSRARSRPRRSPRSS